VTLAGRGPAPVDVVRAGGAGPEFSYQALNAALGHLQAGATLVAMHRGLYWRTSDGPQPDSGAFVTGLEQAAGVEAQVVGKPAAAFFATALAHLGAAAAHTLMVGDDIETDVLAAQRHGLTGVLVKTGKYLPSTHQHATGTPGHVLDSFAGLPALLEQPFVTAATANMCQEISHHADMPVSVSWFVGEGPEMLHSCLPSQ
jgi:ribonucleotide monophosphatase NagD (HAD superfamily)